VRRAPILAVCGVALAALAACQGNSTHSSSPSGTAAPASASASASAAGSGTGAGAGKPVAVHQTIDDPVMGDHVVVTSMVRDFPVPASMSAVSDREIVLVEVTATAGSKYYAGWQTTQLAIVVNGEENQESDTDDLDAAMTRAGYPPVPDGNVDTGKTGTGWVPFVVDPKDAPQLTLRMKRTAATTDSGQDIPAQNFDVPLPK
jgi:hypothetical protein